MAAETDIPLRITVDAAGAGQTLGEVRQSVKDLTAELNRSVEGTKKFNDTLIKLGGAKATLTDLRQNIKALDPEKTAQAFVGLGQSMASGFQFATGAAALFGVENKNIQETLLRVQAATALASGLQGFAGMGKAIQTATLAMKAFALANPFTAILVVLLAIGAALIGFKDKLFGISGEYDKNLKTAKELVVASEKQKENLEGSVNQLKLQGKSEREILMLKIKATDEIIIAREQEMLMAAERLAAQIESDKKNKEILEGILNFIMAPLVLILKTTDAVGSALGQDFGLEEKFKGGVASLLFDPEKTKTEGDKVAAESKAQLDALKEKRAGFQLSIQGIDDKAADDKKKAREKEVDDEIEKNKKIAEEAEKTRQSLVDGLNKGQQIRLTALQTEAKNELEILAINTSDKKVIRDAEIVAINEELDNLFLAKAEIDLSTKLNEEEKSARIIEIALAEAELIHNLKVKGLQQTKENSDKEIDLAKRVAETKKQLGRDAFNAAKGLSDTLFANALQSAKSGSAQERKIKKQQFNLNKAVSATETSISVVQAIQAHLKIPGAGIGLAIMMGVIGAVNVAAILAKKFPEGEAVAAEAPPAPPGGAGGLGGAGGTPAAPTFQPTVTGTQTTAAGEFTGFNNQQPLRAYVVETDISENQQRVNQLQQRASF